MRWDNQVIAAKYVKAIHRQGEIRDTKVYYHDPLFTGFIERVKPKDGESRLVDIGCGNGALTRTLATRNPTMTCLGVDLPVMESHFEATCSDIPNLSFQSGNCVALPLEEGSTDIVISSLLFHWIGQETLSEAIGEMYRVLAQGGNAVVSYIHPDFFHAGEWVQTERYTWYYRRTENTSIPGSKTVWIDKTVGPVIYYRHPIGEVVKLFVSQGFTVEVHQPTFSRERYDDPYLPKYFYHPLYVFIIATK